jgi:hypothetical protein
VSAPDVFAVTAGVFAYGPVPGVELIPYFLALLTWIGLALGALFLSPITAVVRLLRRARGAPPEPKGEAGEPAPPVPSPPPPEPPIEGPRAPG